MTLSHDGIAMLSLLYLEVVTTAYVIWLHLCLVVYEMGFIE